MIPTTNTTPIRTVPGFQVRPLDEECTAAWNAFVEQNAPRSVIWAPGHAVMEEQRALAEYRDRQGHPAVVFAHAHRQRVLLIDGEPAHWPDRFEDQPGYKDRISEGALVRCNDGCQMWVPAALGGRVPA